MVLPAYGRGCLTDLLPALTTADAGPLPVELGSGPRVLFVLDGLGWEQMAQWRHLLPNLSTFAGDAITTVAPSTTASALTSITTSLPPSQHGIVGYRMVVDDMVFNSLRWGSAERPDCRTTVSARSDSALRPVPGSANGAGDQGRVSDHRFQSSSPSGWSADRLSNAGHPGSRAGQAGALRRRRGVRVLRRR